MGIHMDVCMDSFAHFVAVCRTSQMVAMGTRRPRRGWSCSCRLRINPMGPLPIAHFPPRSHLRWSPCLRSGGDRNRCVPPLMQRMATDLSNAQNEYFPCISALAMVVYTVAGHRSCNNQQPGNQQGNPHGPLLGTGRQRNRPGQVHYLQSH